jgi:hypothetical protein
MRRRTVGTCADFYVTPKLTVRFCLHGTHGYCASLHGVSGDDVDYVEDLTLEQTRELVELLNRAIEISEDVEKWMDNP